MENKLPTEYPVNKMLRIYFYRLKVVILSGIIPLCYLFLSFIILLFKINVLSVVISIVFAIALMLFINKSISKVTDKNPLFQKFLSFERQITVIASISLLVITVFFFEKESNYSTSSLPQLNKNEIVYLITKPYLIIPTYNSWREANNESIRKYGISFYKDKSDAFRHCFGTAILVKEIGYQEAIKITTLHESFAENNKYSMLMDMWNNKVGAEIGKKNFHLSNEKISEIVIIQIKNKKLITFDSIKQ